MILRIILFLSYVILVSTNTGFPVIPAQTYPIYQQNGYANPVVNQPNNIAPYVQNTIVQNQSPPMNLSPSNVKNILLNRILSSPSLQSILGSNLGGYGSNLVNFNNNPIAQNPFNNYFEAPNLNEKSINVNKETKVDIETEKPKKSKRKSSKSRRKEEESDKNENKSSKNAKRKDKHTQTIDNTETTKKSKKRKQRKQNSEVSSQNETKNKESENNTERKTKKRKNKENEPTKNDSIEKEIKAENSKSGRRRKKKPKSDDDSEKAPLEQQTTPSVAPKEIKEGIDVVNLNEGIIEENRVPRNSKHEGNDLLKALPFTENTGTNFMKTLSQFDNNPYMSNFFANYENIYQSMLKSGVGRNEKKEKVKTVRQKRTKKHDKRKPAQTKNRNATEATTTIANSKVNPKMNILTTERTIIIKEKTHTNVDTIPKREDLKSFDKKPERKEPIREEDGDYEKTHQGVPSPEALDDGYYNNGYIDDYYPLFTDSAAYNANNKEVYIKNLGDTKYYYAIDKANPDVINRRRFEHYQFPERVVKDYEVNKRYEDTEKEGMKNLKTENEDKIIEEIKFRSPPHLEIPDFQTRKIDKSELIPNPVYNFEDSNNINHRFVGDKSQIDVKSLNKQKQNGITDIETVFARSNVVKYGTAISSEEDIPNVEIDKPPPAEEKYLKDEASTHFKDEGTTYVFAKSLDYPEKFW